MAEGEAPIQIVDQNDRPVRGATMEEAQAQGLYHRIVRVLVEDGEGNVLLQKRAPGMMTYPNCWDTSAAGHVDEGESYEAAAARELSEEIGFNGTLEEVGSYQTRLVHVGKTFNRFNRTYKTTATKSTAFSLQAKEVTEVRWFSIEEVKALIADHPELVTDGVMDNFSRYY